MKNNLFSHKFFSIAILLLAAFLRLYGLGLNPIGMSHDDELQELINAKSIAMTGQPSFSMAAGIFSSIKNCPGNCVYGELGSFILIPWMRVFPLDLFWSKIPFVLASLGVVYFTGKLFENLSNSQKVGLISAFIVAINPWAIHFGRTAYFTTFSYTFYISAAYFFTRRKSLKSNVLRGTIFSIIASLFYFGTKPILPFIVVWGLLYNIYTFRKFDLKFNLLIVALCASIIGLYLFLLSQTFAGRRISEVGLGSIYNIESIVDEQRRISLEIPFVRDIFINKLTVQAGIVLEKYLGFFSPVFLYVKSIGSTDLYYVSNHAYNYIIDFPFLMLGVMAMASGFLTGIFTLSLVGLAISPAAIKVTGDTIYTLRTGLAYPLLSGITGWGIYYMHQKILRFQKTSDWAKKFSLSKLFIILIGLTYTVSLIYFLVMYWSRVPIDKSQGWYLHKRVLANYIQRVKNENGGRIFVVTAQPADTFNTYIFYSGKYDNKETILEINSVYASQNYEYKGATFTNDCGQNLTNEYKNGTTIFIEQGSNCSLDSPSVKIANPKDAGGLYNIHNETLCSNFPKNKYPYPRNLEDFQIEKMTKEDFCIKWITNPD